MEEFAAEIQTFRMSRQGFVSGDGWEYKPSQDSSEYRIRFAFDKETKRIVNYLLAHEEARGRNQKLAEVHRLEKLEFDSRALATAATALIDDFNARPWYERVWIALFSKV